MSHENETLIFELGVMLLMDRRANIELVWLGRGMPDIYSRRLVLLSKKTQP